MSSLEKQFHCRHIIRVCMVAFGEQLLKTFLSVDFRLFKALEKVRRWLLFLEQFRELAVLLAVEVPSFIHLKPKKPETLFPSLPLSPQMKKMIVLSG